VKFCQISGFTTDELIGKYSNLRKSNYHSDDFYNDLWTTILSGKTWKGEFRNKNKNGSLIWEYGTITAIKDSDGNITNFLAIYEDLTEHKKLVNDLVSAKDKAEESDRLKSAFLANISHEIRTPMNGILGFTSLLKEPDLTMDEMHEYSNIIERSGNRMLRTINDLIDISKIESGQMPTYISEVIVNEQMNDLYSFFLIEAESKNIKLTCNKDLNDDECIIQTDHEKLYGILVNLLKNAIKFTNEGNIEFGYERKGEFIEFYVKDTGIGIPADRQKAIFDRFIQADLNIANHYEGAGLGLSISTAYVKMLKGKMWLTSKEGEGSQFYFTIPFTKI
jgi:PAS domain S-box-containing protein